MKTAWPVKQFGEIAEFKNGLNFSANDRGGRIKIIGVSDFQDHFRINHRDLGEVEIEGTVPDGFLLKNRDLVFVRSNGSKALVGRCLLIENVTEPVTHSGFTIRARVNCRDVDSEFVGYFFQTSLARRAIATAGGGTNISNLSQELLAAIPVPFPTLAEQLKIAATIRSWEKSIKVLEALVLARTERKRGLMQQLVTGQTRFRGFKEKWTHCHLGDVVQAMSRPVAWDENELYRLASVRRWCGGVFSREELRGDEIKVKKLQTIRTGDFLISHIQAAYGAMALVPQEFDGAKVSELYTILRPKDPKAFDIRILGYLGQTKRMWYMAIQASNGFFAERLRLNFDPEEFLRLPVNIPPTFAEQKKIADTLEACDCEITLLQKQLEALKEQKRGLMQKLLTGEIRVKAERGGRSAELPHKSAKRAKEKP